MGGGAWWAAVHRVVKSRTRPNDFTFTFHFPSLEKEMATHSSVLSWRIPGTGEPGGLPSMGSQSRTRLKQLGGSSSIFFRVLYPLVVNSLLLVNNYIKLSLFILCSSYLLTATLTNTPAFGNWLSLSITLMGPFMAPHFSHHKSYCPHCASKSNELQGNNTPQPLPESFCRMDG